MLENSEEKIISTEEMGPSRKDKMSKTATKSSRKADAEFLQQILRVFENDPRLEVKSVDHRPACAMGDNYMSLVSRINCTGTRRGGLPYKMSLISKYIVEDVCHQEFFKSVEIFANEARFYKIMPILLGADQKLVPYCFYADSQMIFLEDLQSAGFVMVDRTKGLDLAHAMIVMKALAEFHAASFVLEYTEPEKYEVVRREIKELIFPQDSDHEGIKWMLNKVPKLTKCFLEAAATPNDNYVKEIDFLLGIGDRTYETLKEIIKPRKYAVVCAGDCWISNVLFRYEEIPAERSKSDSEVEKTVAEVRLIDFQGARYSSVAIDILYFLHNSVRHEIIETHLDDMLRMYHERLTSKLECLPKRVFEELNFEWLKSELRSHELYGLFMSLWLIPAFTMDSKDLRDVSSVATTITEEDFYTGYTKDRLTPEMLRRVCQKCKFFIK